MIAVVDEAIYQPGDGVYVLAAVLVDESAKAEARRAARRVPVIRGRRFHWHKEDDREQFAMLRAIEQHSLGAIAYVASPARGREQEAIRQALMVLLAKDAAHRKATELTIESRQHRNDGRDGSTLIKVRREMSIELAYAHAKPTDEPLLWMGDAIAGAVLAQARKDGRYVEALPSGLLSITQGP
ncbi:MAG: hypothetical protein ACYC91_20335 [Solirubrobacteraceae bacterium]